METTIQLPPTPPVRSSDSFGDLTHADRRYSVICDKQHSRHVVATGLEWSDAREMCDRLDREYRERIKSAGQYYSSWMADLHECQLESPNY